MLASGAAVSESELAEAAEMTSDYLRLVGPRSFEAHERFSMPHTAFCIPGMSCNVPLKGVLSPRCAFVSPRAVC